MIYRDEEGAYHAETCPLHEISEHDCAYNLLLCNCGYGPEHENDNERPNVR